MSSSMKSHKGEISVRFHFTNFPAIRRRIDLKILHFCCCKLLVAGPFKCLCPGFVSKPVADVVGVAGVDQDGHLLEKCWDKTVEWLHPVTLEEEVAIDVEIAGLVALDLHTQCFHHRGFVEPFRDISKLLVAEIATILTLSPNIVDILASALIGADQSVVAVDRSWDARPGAATVVATRDQRLATWESVLHRLTP